MADNCRTRYGQKGKKITSSDLGVFPLSLFGWLTVNQKNAICLDSLKLVYMVLDTMKGLVIPSKIPRLGLHAEKFASVTEQQTDSTSKA